MKAFAKYQRKAKSGKDAKRLKVGTAKATSDKDDDEEDKNKAH